MYNFNIDESLDGELTINVKVVGIITQKDGNQLEYTSNIITFRSEDPVVDNTTKDVIMGLSFKCMDNSEGNYFLYNYTYIYINIANMSAYIFIIKKQFYIYVILPCITAKVTIFYIIRIVK